MQICCPQCSKPYAGLSNPLSPGVLCTFCDSLMTLPATQKVLDSGKRRQFPSGAVRDDSTGKGRFDLLPMTALEVVAKHFEAGAQKYGDNNWRKGVPMNAFFDSGLRHLVKAIRGDVDEDHLAAAAWNILCAIETRDVLSKKPAVDDEEEWPDIIGAHPDHKKLTQFPPTAPEKVSYINDGSQ